MAFLFGLQDTLLDFFEKGGGVVVFIGFLIILMWSFILERFWYFKYIHSDVEKDIQNAWRDTPDRKSWSGHQIRSMLISKANVKISSNLEYIRVAIVLAPLLGLLGTILGMIEVFHILAVTGGGDAKQWPVVLLNPLFQPWRASWQLYQLLLLQEFLKKKPKSNQIYYKNT